MPEVDPVLTPDDAVVTGVLLGIALFPVKSVAGWTPSSAVVDRDGLAHDRGYALVDADGVLLTAKNAPGLRRLVLGGDPASPTVTAPDGSDPASVVGRDVRLQARSGGVRQVAAVHVVTTAQRRAPGAGDSARANLVCDFGAGEPDPDDFVGARLVVGDVELHLGQRPRHCAGLFAAVLVPGTVRVGDPVRLHRGG